MRHFVPLKTLRLSVLVICCGLLGLTTACRSSEDPATTKTETAAADAPSAAKKKKQQPVEVERSATGTVNRFMGKRLFFVPDGAKKKLLLFRGTDTAVSGIKEHWYDLDAGYRVEVTWIQGTRPKRKVVQQIVVLSKGHNTKPPLSEFEAEPENPPAS